jgi:hypothetical protein
MALQILKCYAYLILCFTALRLIFLILDFHSSGFVVGSGFGVVVAVVDANFGMLIVL